MSEPMTGTVTYTAVCQTCKKPTFRGYDCCVLSKVPLAEQDNASAHQHQDYLRGWNAGWKSGMILGLVLEVIGLAIGFWSVWWF